MRHGPPLGSISSCAATGVDAAAKRNEKPNAWILLFIAILLGWRGGVDFEFYRSAEAEEAVGIVGNVDPGADPLAADLQIDGIAAPGFDTLDEKASRLVRKQLDRRTARLSVRADHRRLARRIGYGIAVAVSQIADDRHIILASERNIITGAISGSENENLPAQRIAGGRIGCIDLDAAIEIGRKRAHHRWAKRAAARRILDIGRTETDARFDHQLVSARRLVGIENGETVADRAAERKMAVRHDQRSAEGKFAAKVAAVLVGEIVAGDLLERGLEAIVDIGDAARHAVGPIAALDRGAGAERTDTARSCSRIIQARIIVVAVERRINRRAAERDEQPDVEGRPAIFGSAPIFKAGRKVSEPESVRIIDADGIAFAESAEPLERTIDLSASRFAEAHPGAQTRLHRNQLPAQNRIERPIVFSGQKQDAIDGQVARRIGIAPAILQAGPAGGSFRIERIDRSVDRKCAHARRPQDLATEVGEILVALPIDAEGERLVDAISKIAGAVVISGIIAAHAILVAKRHADVDRKVQQPGVQQVDVEKGRKLQRHRLSS